MAVAEPSEPAELASARDILLERHGPDLLYAERRRVDGGEVAEVTDEVVERLRKQVRRGVWNAGIVFIAGVLVSVGAEGWVRIVGLLNVASAFGLVTPHLWGYRRAVETRASVRRALGSARYAAPTAHHPPPARG